MYGYTPPAVIAVDPDLLAGCGDFQRLASTLASELRMRPVWCVVSAPDSLIDADAAQRSWIVEGWFRDPRGLPEELAGSPHEATAQVLASHVQDAGFQLPIRHGPFAPQPHVPGSCIVPGTWQTAAEAALALQAPHVIAWTEDRQVVLENVAGVPFIQDPRAAQFGALDGPTFTF